MNQKNISSLHDNQIMGTVGDILRRIVPMSLVALDCTMFQLTLVRKQ